MSLKQMNVKQAYKWLDKLKTQNLQSYKDITKFLRKYEKTQDELDCYVKMSHTLLCHSKLTEELNNYVEEANKFVVNRPEDEKIKELMGYFKKNRPDIFDKIIQMIQELSKTKGQNPLEISKSLKPRLWEIIEGDKELERITEEALDLTGEDLINRKNLEHLKVVRTAPHPPEDDKDTLKVPSLKLPLEKQTPKHEQRHETTRRDPSTSRPSRPLIGLFANSSEQKLMLRSIEKSVDPQSYLLLIKLIKIYHLNIITRNQIFEILSQLKIDQYYLQNLKDILETRQTERRKKSLFKPLNDMNFSNEERPSPSYVSMPLYYPIRCSAKTHDNRTYLNDKWVSVPHGSEQNENFSVRFKNANEINLLKAEDQRYEFDLYVRRLRAAHSLLQKITDQSPKTQKQRDQLITKMIEMGFVQLLYKNCDKTQKEQMEHYMKVDNYQLCQLFKQKAQIQIHDLKTIKDIHANKSWNEVAVKNFYKALDLKGFEYKKNEKERMKNTYFVAELAERTKTLQNGGQPKTLSLGFDEKKQFFAVLNSFQSSSRTEKCNSRSLPQVETFDLKDETQRHLYPLMILAFEQQDVCQQLYSMIIFFIDALQINEQEKNRCKSFLDLFLRKFLGWTSPCKRVLTQYFDEEKLYAKIAQTLQEDLHLENWLVEYRDEHLESTNEQEQESKFKLKLMKDDQLSPYSFHPHKSQQKVVLYGSQHLYTLIRFIYTLYERLIKLREVAQNPEKLLLFELLFQASIKAREGIKFEQNLNLLLGKHAYLFSTLYKLFDNLLKSLSSVSICPLTNYSFKIHKEKSEDIYLLLLNRFCLNNNLVNNKILRLTYHKTQKLIYFNYFDSYYKSEETGKDLIKKRNDISRQIELYTLDPFPLKKRKPNEVLEHNAIEYNFEGTTIKMINHHTHEDLLLLKTKKEHANKHYKKQLLRSHLFNDKLR